MHALMLVAEGPVHTVPVIRTSTALDLANLEVDYERGATCSSVTTVIMTVIVSVKVNSPVKVMMALTV